MLKKCLFVVFFVAMSAWSCFADCGLGPTDKQYRVRNVEVDALFGKIPKALQEKLDKHRGEVFDAGGASFSIGSGTSDSVDKYKTEVRAFLEKENALLEDNSYGAKKGGIYIRATFATTCVDIIPGDECLKSVSDENGVAVANCVDVVIKYRVIPINTGNPAANVLDLARSNQLRFYRELPRPILAFDPHLGIEHDNTYGPSLVGSIKVDLLSLPSTVSGGDLEVRQTTLELTAHGRKSLSLPLFSGDANLQFSHSRPGRRVSNLVIGAGYATERDRRGTADFSSESAGFRGDVRLNLNAPVIDQVSAGAGYRRKRSRLENLTGEVEHTLENVSSLRVITDGKLGRGFIRSGVWFDHSSESSDGLSYSKLATQVGYAQNLSLTSKPCKRETDEEGPLCVFAQNNSPVVGIELVFGLGRSWGTLPEYSKFFGGNGGSNFLYDAHDAPSLVESPAGPSFRSIGRNKAGAAVGPSGAIGGTSYESLSMSVSLPVKSWSKPLIPAVPIVDRPTGGGCTGCGSLKDVLKNQVDKGRNIYIDTLASQSLTDEQRADLGLDPDDGLTPEEQERLARATAAFEAARVKMKPRADAVWKELTPTIEFIADKANLYSIKPLVMFDLARISASGESPGKVRVGIGGGLQLNVVIAKFELGYIHTVRGVPGDDRGNFIIRTIFEKLF